MTKIMRNSLYTPSYQVKLRLFFHRVESTYMTSQEERLNHLGISVWKKIPKQNDSDHADGYSIENKYLFFFSHSIEPESENNKILFLKTLAISLGIKNVSKITVLDEIPSIEHIFLLGAKLPSYLQGRKDSSITELSSINEICSSGESKSNFLASVKQTIN